MARTHRPSTTVALIVSLLGAPSATVLQASDGESSTGTTRVQAAALHDTDSTNTSFSAVAGPLFYQTQPASSFQSFRPSVPVSSAMALALNASSTSVASLAQTEPWVQAPFATDRSDAFAQRGRYRGRGGRNAGPATAIVLGAAASIAGAAVLVYANRPDCRLNPRAGGCGYGTKVVGGAVLAGGVVGVIAGALTWR